MSRGGDQALVFIYGIGLLVLAGSAAVTSFGRRFPRRIPDEPS